jgi:hypothetical protein
MFSAPFHKWSLLTLAILFTFSCGGNLGFGVLLWSPDEELIPSGSAIKVLSQSSINDSYIIRTFDNNEKIEIPLWRVDLFEKNEEMENALKLYQPWVTTYARCEKRGLPIRTEPEIQGGNTIYKLTEGQEAKVLQRQQEPVTIGNLEGYWYLLLTADGVKGWCFDYYLQVYSLGEDNQVTMENQQVETDEFLAALYDRAYYPSNYEEKINNGYIDLTSINTDYFFKIDSENKRIILINQNNRIEENYDSVANTSFHSYSFIGTSFRIEAYNSDILSLQYNYQGKEYKEGYVFIQKPIEEILEDELSRRSSLAKEFLNQGPDYTSDTYGELSFMDQNSFFWKDKSILISMNILDVEAGNQGSITFDRFLDRSLRNKYRGVISFNFTNGQHFEFLYQWKNDGVLLLQVPQSQIERNVIKSDQFLNTLQIFFRIDQNNEEN